MSSSSNQDEGFTLYIRMAILLIIINIIGFGPTFYFASLTQAKSLDTLRVVHGVLFSSWYVLFFAQVTLARIENFKLHKYLGFFAIIVAALVIADGIIMSAYFANDFEPSDNIGDLIYKATGVWANFHLVASFSIFALLGFLNRKKLQLHKRFMLMSTIAMMTAAVTRIAQFEFIPIHAGAFSFLGIFFLILMPVAYEYRKYGKVHPIYKWGSVLYFITLIIFAAVFPFTSFGQSAVFWFQ